MDWFDCCSSIACCDCCDCCSMTSGCCPDCYGAGYGTGVLPDGTKEFIENWLEKNVTIVGGSACTCQPYILPTASESVKGGIKIGHSLLMADETLNVALDTTSSTIEGFMWINDIASSVETSSGETGGFDTFTKEDVDDIFRD
ncbi:MAG: hypothetical protein IJQ82_02725 [Selenomonadaceae bacterium]|nr:hypothetical protein [Selenomonadaceae bacterium]